MKIKRLLVLFIGVALIMFFTLPAIVFAEPGDNSTALGDQGDPYGQYQMDPNMSADPDDSYADPPEESNGENIEVYCIDVFTPHDTNTDAYEETSTDVSDELISDGVDPDNAEAVEIMATTAVGALEYENQHAVWELLTDSTSSEPDPTSQETIQKVIDATLTLAEEFNLAEVDPLSPYFGMTLDQFLDAKNVNEIDVTLDSDPLVNVNGNYNEFDATAIMENPLVPEVTDEGKSVFWYILAGSYNVSFSEFDLITEETSTMTDKVDVNDATDEDGDGNKADDHYGYATIPYYFYWWGNGYPEFEEMSVNIGACVDIDEDGDIDKEQGEDLDEFNLKANVVQTIVDGSQHIVETDSGGNVVTAIPSNVDIDYYNAGKVLVTYTRDEAEEQELDYPVDQRFVIESYSEPCDGDSETYSAWGSFEVIKTDSETDNPVEGAVYKLTYIGGQTNTPDPIPVYTLTTGADGKASVSGLLWGTYEFTEFSSPPGYGLDPNTYTVNIGGTALFEEGGSIDAGLDVQNDPQERSYGSITVIKKDETGALLDGVGFTLYYKDSGNPVMPEQFTSGGLVTFSGLAFGTYIIVETTTPAGYDTSDPVEVTIDASNAEAGVTITRIDTKTPPRKTPPPPRGGEIEVLGIQELPFTGMNPVIPISGISTLFAGGLMVVLSTIRKRFGRK